MINIESMAPVAYHSREVLLQDNNDSRIKNAVYIITIGP